MGTRGWTHFVGIGGVGMSALAQLLLCQGYRVSGSDPKENQFTRKLKARGAVIYNHHEAANINPGVKEVVVSSAVSPANPEVIAAYKRGLAVIKRGELLARLFNECRGIAVAGAHGKTTTSAMVALAIKEGGLDPTAVIGGLVREFGSNFTIGEGPFFVAESDESDGSFLWLQPEVALVTNIEEDHMDYYASLEDIMEAFKGFIDRVRPGGKAILCIDCPRVKELSYKCSTKVITYGLKGNPDYKADSIKLNGLGSKATVSFRGQYLGELNLVVPGRHNIQNALGAVAAAHQLGVPFTSIARALKSFRGVGRRFEVLWCGSDIWIVDDYAHHPTEVNAALQAAKQVGAKRVVAVFQPHRYSRTAHLYREFGKVLRHADIVVINDVYSAGEEPIPGVTSQLIIDEIQKNGCQRIYYIPSVDKTADLLKEICTGGDLIITLGAGDVWKVGHNLALCLKMKQDFSEMGA